MLLNPFFKNRNSLALLLVIVLNISCSKVPEYTVVSPNGENVFTVFTDQTGGIGFEVMYEDKLVLLPSVVEII